MTTSTIVLIVVVAVVAILLIATIAWVARNKRIQHRRVEAGNIREKDMAEQSHKVGQREALADETAAKARAAQAEADAKAAHATGLQHQAVRRNNAATARDEVNQEFERADKIDPDTQTNDDTPRQDSETRETPRGTPAGKQGPPPMPRSG